MSQQAVPRRLTRRTLAGLAAGTVLAASRRALAGPRAPMEEPDLVSVRVKGPVPAADPDSALWARAKAVDVAVIGQAMVIPTKMKPSASALKVRSLHDGARIAFLLEWADPRPDVHSIKTEQFRDSCGVLLGPHPSDPMVWMMGTPGAPVTLLHWRADWQRDVDAGFQDLEVAFPNVAFDFYPPLVGATHPLRLPEAYPPGARVWLPGWHVGNPLSQPVKRTPVEELRARGPGTIEPFPGQDAVGRGRWKGGGWRVVLAKPMQARDAQEIALAPGKAYAIAFALWAGSERDAGARKSVTRKGRLRIAA